MAAASCALNSRSHTPSCRVCIAVFARTVRIDSKRPACEAALSVEGPTRCAPKYSTPRGPHVTENLWQSVQWASTWTPAHGALIAGRSVDISAIARGATTRHVHVHVGPRPTAACACGVPLGGHRRRRQGREAIDGGVLRMWDAGDQTARGLGCRRAAAAPAAAAARLAAASGCAGVEVSVRDRQVPLLVHVWAGRNHYEGLCLRAAVASQA